MFGNSAFQLLNMMLIIAGATATPCLKETQKLAGLFNSNSSTFRSSARDSNGWTLLDREYNNTLHALFI